MLYAILLTEQSTPGAGLSLIADFTAGGFAVVGLLILIILILILIGGLPAWPYARGWGYGPSGVVGLLVVILIVLLLLRYI
jgi:hypothetical protein